MKTKTDQQMRMSSIGMLRFYQYQGFDAYPGLVHGIFARGGGHSPPPFDSLNVALSVGDDVENVHRNRSAISACFDGAPMVFLHQTHGAVIHILKQSASPSLTAFSSADPPVGDALISDIPGVLLAIQVADCQPILIADPCRKVVANVHSGWRGSVQDIIGRTVARMVRDFGCDPADLMAGIGPSLGPCCAEFIHYERELPPAFHSYRVSDYHFDFWAISRDQLLAAGLRPGRIFIGGLCTRCRDDLFFSYRRGRTTGRFAAVIGFRLPY